MSNDITNPEDIIRRQLEAVNSRTQESTGVVYVSIDNDSQEFVFPDGRRETEINGVILDFITQNKYYKGRYVKGSKKPPECYAIGYDLNTMAPSKHATEPQSDLCRTCPQNEFPGDGGPKPCKNTRRVAFLHTGTSENPEGNVDPQTARIHLLQISPSGLRDFDKYARDLAGKGVPLCKVITKFSFTPNLNYARVEPAFVELNPAFEETVRRVPDADPVLSYDPAPEKESA